MALVLADRVQDSTTTTGTGTITLANSPATGFQSFAAIGNGNTTYYTITSGSAWEVGIGTYSSTGPTLARTTILSSSNAGAAISLTGTSTVFVSYPAEYAVQSQSPTINNPTFNNTAQFTPNASTPTAATGLTYFSQGNDAFTVVNATGATEYMNRSVLIRVHNGTGSTIAAGKVVYINGNYVGQYPTIALAQANSFSTIVAIGITNAAIANNTNGYVTLSGLITGIDTSAYTAGTDLFLSPTTAGGLTSTVPSTPNYSVQVGVVTNSSTNGSMILVPVYLSVPATNVVGSNLMLGVQGTSQGTIQLYNTASGAYSTTLASSNSATAAYTLTLPVNAGTSGYVLSTDGTGITSWVANSSSGTVTSVNASGGTTGLSFSGGPVTTSGTLTLGGTLAVANGGTGVTTSTGTGSVVLSTSPTLVTPALGTPSSGTVTNLTGTASININGTVGATTPTTGAFTTATASTSVTTPFYIANGTITSALTAGAYSYGTLGYSDTGIFSSFTLSQNSYNQMILQNMNSGAAASADFIVSNNNGTATTYYGDFGINSSGFTGSGSLNLANAVYLYSNSGDLVLGTATSNAVHFVINGGTTDAVVIATTGKTTFQASSTTAASINLTPGTAPTSPVNGDMWSTSAGVYAQVNGSTVGPFGTGGGGGTLTVGSTATSGGAAGQIMFDTGSVLSESSSLTFASATRKLTVGGPTTFSAGTSNSVAAWSTSGVNFVQSAATFTDNTTAASGTVPTAYMNLFGAQTYAATNTSVTVNNLYGTYFVAPNGGTNVAATTKWAVGADSLTVNGSFTATAGAYSIALTSTSLQLGANTGNTSIFTASGSISIYASTTGTVGIGGGTATGTISVGVSTATQTLTLHSGATTSGNTKTITIGTGGLSGSTTVISIGSTAAPGVITVNGSYQPLTAATTSGSTITPTAGTTNQYNVTALAASATIAAPSGTPVDGQRLTIRFKDNGTAQALTWTTTSGAYRAVGVTLPTTTVISKALYVGCIYNSQDTFWDVVAVAQQ